LPLWTELAALYLVFDIKQNIAIWLIEQITDVEVCNKSQLENIKPALNSGKLEDTLGKQLIQETQLN
jgi:hypothetical protein